MYCFFMVEDFDWKPYETYPFAWLNKDHLWYANVKYFGCCS